MKKQDSTFDFRKDETSIKHSLPQIGTSSAPSTNAQAERSAESHELVDAYGIPFSQERKIEIPPHIQNQDAWNLINQRLLNLQPRVLAVVLPWDQLSSHQKARLAVVNDTRMLKIKLTAPEQVKSYFERWSWNTEYGYMEFRHLEDFRGVDFNTFLKDVVQLSKWAHVERQLLYGDKSPHLPPASLHYHTSAAKLDTIVPLWILYLYLNHAEVSWKNPENISSLSDHPLGRSTEFRVIHIEKDRIENRMQIGNFLTQAQTLNAALSLSTFLLSKNYLTQQIQRMIHPELIDHIVKQDPLSLLELGKWTLTMDSSTLGEVRNDLYQVTALNEKKYWSQQDQLWVLSLAEHQKKQLLYKVLQPRRKLQLGDSFLIELSSSILKMNDERLLGQLKFFIEEELQDKNEDKLEQSKHQLFSEIRKLPEFQNLTFGQKILFSTEDQLDYPSPEELVSELWKTSSFFELQDLLEALIHHPKSDLSLIQKVLDKMLRSSSGDHFFLSLYVFIYPRIPKEKLLNSQQYKDFSNWRANTFAEMMDIGTPTPWHTARIVDTIDSLHTNTTDLFSHPNLWMMGLGRLWKESRYHASPTFQDRRCLTYTSCEKLQKTLIKNIQPTRNIHLSNLTEDTGISIAKVFTFHRSQRLVNDVVLQLLRRRPLPESFWIELIDYFEKDLTYLYKDLNAAVPEDILEELNYVLEKLTSRKKNLRLDDTTLQKLDPFLHLEPIAKFKSRFNKPHLCDNLF